MQTTDLLYPGDCTHGKTIRREVAAEISTVQIAVQQGAPLDPRFGQFLADAASKCPGGNTGAVVINSATVNVENSAGALDSPATAVVAAGVLTSVKLAATKTIVTHAQSINVENSAGALDSPATAVVAAGVITGVNLAETKTILTDALKFSGVTITGSGTFFTPTIVNGVLTGGVLSAS